MESKAHLRYLRIAPRKVGQVAALVRGKQVGAALNILKFTRKHAAKPLEKLIKSAIANATDLSKGQVDIDTLYVKHISVDQGPSQRRYMPRAMGRATKITKKSSHVHVVLASAEKGRGGEAEA
ncbi:MAG TPA: 50S ribosomal protein L22 [Myxococcaceae bacterium]|nr:50S ribosomal protein L22 [Myxococcaceae bacterium]